MSTAKPNPIKEARLRKSLTQQNVADALGVSKGAVSRWETGTDEPAPRKALALIRLLPGLKIEHIYPTDQGRAAA